MEHPWEHLPVNFEDPLPENVWATGSLATHPGACQSSVTQAPSPSPGGRLQNMIQADALAPSLVDTW